MRPQRQNAKVGQDDDLTALPRSAASCDLGYQMLRSRFHINVECKTAVTDQRTSTLHLHQNNCGDRFSMMKHQANPIVIGAIAPARQNGVLTGIWLYCARSIRPYAIGIPNIRGELKLVSVTPKTPFSKSLPSKRNPRRIISNLCSVGICRLA